MDAMGVLIVAVFLVVGALAAIGLATLIVLFISGATKRKARRLAVLQDSCSRMRTVVADLLERVNDLDQQTKFLTDKNIASTHKDRLAVAATDLVTVSECLPSIEQCLAEKRFDDAADLLSASSRVLEKVVRIIGQVQPAAQAGYVLPDGSTKLKMPEGKESVPKKQS